MSLEDPEQVLALLSRIAHLEDALREAARGNLEKAQQFAAGHALGVTPEDPDDFLKRIPLGTPEEERQRAENWVRDAILHHRNEEYWQRQCEEAGREIQKLMGKR